MAKNFKNTSVANRLMQKNTPQGKHENSSPIPETQEAQKSEASESNEKVAEVVNIAPHSVPFKTSTALTNAAPFSNLYKASTTLANIAPLSDEREHSTMFTNVAPLSQDDETSTTFKRGYVAPQDRRHRNFSNPREVKTKRANFLLRPSTYEKFKEIAKSKGLSYNDAADEALRLYYEHNAASLLDNGLIESEKI